MRRVYKSALRDLYFQKARSFIIIVAVVIIISFPLALNSVTLNLDNSMKADQEQYRLAHFNVIFPELVSQTAMDKISTIIESTIGRPPTASEAILYLSSKYRFDNGEWTELVVRSISEQTPEPVNQLVIDEGRKPTNENETLVLTSFAKAEGLRIGDVIPIYSPVGKVNYTVVGFGRSVEFLSYNLVQDGVVFLHTKGALKFLGLPLNTTQRNSFLFYIDEQVTLEEETKIVEALQEEFTEEKGETPIAFTWVVREVSFRKSLKDALTVTSSYMFVSTIFIFLIAGVVIFVVTNRYINDQKIIIGAIYAFGTNKGTVIMSYIFRITLLFILGAITGIVAGNAILKGLMQSIVDTWGLLALQAEIPLGVYLQVIISAYIIVIGFSVLALLNLFRLTPYEAMRGKTSEFKSSGILHAVSKILPGRTLRMAWRNLTRNRTRTALTIVSFTTALIFVTSILYTFDSVNGTVNSYFDENIHFDILVNAGFEDSFTSLQTKLKNLEGVEAVEPYLELLAQIKGHPDHVAYLKGLQQNTTMLDIDLIDGRMYKPNTSEVLISQYLRGNFGYQIGDQIQLFFLGRTVNLTIVGVNNDIFRSASITFDLAYLATLVEDPTTGLPLSNFGLTFHNAYFLKLTSKEIMTDMLDTLNEDFPEINYAISVNDILMQVESLISSQTIVIYLIVILGLAVGTITVFTTLFISLVERDKEMSIIRIFGYFKRELFIGVLWELLITGGLALGITLIASPQVAQTIWLPLVSETLMHLTLFVNQNINVFVSGFTVVMLLVSGILSFREATRLKPSETLRLEFL